MTPCKRLEGAIALITGGASGLGLAAGRRLHEEGARIIVTDIAENRDATAAIDALYLHHDVSSEFAWKQVFERVKDEFGYVDVLVNNAGIVQMLDIETCEIVDWEKVIGVNLTGTMLGCKYAAKLMTGNPAGPRGSIINISSIASYFGHVSVSYTATKAAVAALTKSVAVDLGRKYRNIRCNSVHPGTIHTAMVEKVFASASDPEEFRREHEGRQPLQRIGRPEDVAALIAYLASNDAAFVTGAEFLVDGGRLAAMSS